MANTVPSETTDIRHFVCLVMVIFKILHLEMLKSIIRSIDYFTSEFKSFECFISVDPKRCIRTIFSDMLEWQFLTLLLN